MFEKVLLWIKDNYEKIILYCILVLWIGTGVRLLGWDKEGELKAFGERLKPPEAIRKNNLYDEHLKDYLIARPFSFYEPLLRRNPFFPPREPVIIEDGEPPQPPPPEMNFKLVGVVFTLPVGKHAFLENVKTGENYPVVEGQVVEGWNIEKITHNSITIFREGAPYHRYTLTL